MKRLIFGVALIVGALSLTDGASAVALQQASQTSGVNVDPAVALSTSGGLQGGSASDNQDTPTEDLSTVQPNQSTPTGGTFSKQNIMAEADPNSPSHSSHWLTITLLGVLALVIALSYATFSWFRHRRLPITGQLK